MSIIYYIIMITLVKQSKKKLKKKRHIFAFFILFIMFSIIINPAKYTTAAFNGLEVWAKVLIPALFPFFVLTKLFSSTGLATDISCLFAKPIKRLYNCPPSSSYIFFMSIITGYPVGAKMVSECYENGSLTQNEAARTLAFCSNSGPMFILGSVAIGMFNNFKMGIIIYLSHIFGALLNGFVYKNYGIKNGLNKNSKNILTKSQSLNFSETIFGATNSILLIGGVVCFSFVLTEFIVGLKLFNGFINFFASFGIDANVLKATFCGLLEITKGTIMMSSLPISSLLATVLCTFVISFGGVCTLMQALAFTKNIIPTKMLMLQKFTHAIIAAAIALIIASAIK